MGGALISVLVLSLLVFVHEFGHFLVARAAGVRVLRFSIGFGPRLLHWKRGHTEYAVSAIPLGGYVKMAGEQHAQRSHQPWEFLSKPIGTRARIVFAGPLVNYLMALVSLWLLFVIGSPELLPVVGKVHDGTPAQAAGVLVGERVVAVDGKPVQSWEEMTAIIHRGAGQPLAFELTKDDARRTLTIMPQAKTITDPFGREHRVGLVGVSPSGEFETRRAGPVAAVGRALALHNEWIGQTFLGLWAMLTGRISLRESMTGPIGILVLTSEAARHGLAPVIYLMSLLSLSLAIFNVLPIPILDGGHLFFLAIEKLRGRAVSVNVQERAAQASLVVLVTFVLFVCMSDLERFGLINKVMKWISPN
ncbi:MAG: RIP metalloprotease RseP [Candidatus Omnitrophica bacterium]|nr:RIP metalloprotease RseP [Candidatus Omnitrophota bacterium]